MVGPDLTESLSAKSAGLKESDRSTRANLINGDREVEERLISFHIS